MRATLLAISCLAWAWALPSSAESADAAPQPGVMLRARVIALDGEAPTRIMWFWGGGALGKAAGNGELTRLHPQPTLPTTALEPAESTLPLTPPPDAPDPAIEVGEAYDYRYLARHEWSDPVPVRPMYRGQHPRFMSFRLITQDSPQVHTGGVLELEFSHAGQVLKTLRVKGPDAPVFTVIIPFQHLTETGAPQDGFAANLITLHDYVAAKLRYVQDRSDMAAPLPRLYAMLTDCGGYGDTLDPSDRTSDLDTMLTEFRVLRLIGINGVRGAPLRVKALIAAGEGIGSELRRAVVAHPGGFPLPMVKRSDNTKPGRHPGDGCPYFPANRELFAARAAQTVETLLAVGAEYHVDAVWGLSKDEIGSIFGGAPEGIDHMGSCAYCIAAFQDLVRADGLTLQDFGATDWQAIRPTQGYWSLNYWDSLAVLKAKVARAETRLHDDAAAQADRQMETVGDIVAGRDPVAADLATLDDGAAGESASRLLALARQELEDLEWRSRLVTVPEAKRLSAVSPRGWKLLTYYTWRFEAESSAAVFAQTRQQVWRANQRKREALAGAQADSPAGRQPWIHSYALRRNTFLMGGDALGFFDYYRHADTAMVYETSNRDPRVWQWDSYLCDVGRSLSTHRGTAFGVYVKPHRGAATQRALAAISRGADMILWYTYGPEWSKGDNFGGNRDLLVEIAAANRLIAAAEDVTYGAVWAVSPRVAIVRPRTAEFWGDDASWENGKWVYSALQHAHLPVEPVDEDLLLELDLSRYRAIVVSGSHIRRDVAVKLKHWVRDGGVLYTCGGGLRRDEADEPLDVLHDLFGVSTRVTPEVWASPPRYSGTRLQVLQPVGEARPALHIRGGELLPSLSPLACGREVLHPLDPADVRATYPDGTAAAIRHRFGAGTAWLIGSYAGIEYAISQLSDVGTGYDPERRAWISAPLLDAGITPVVAASSPLVETVLLRHPESGRRAIVLINWSGGAVADLRLTIEAGQRITTCRSAATGAELSVQAHPTAGSRVITLPALERGDILICD